MHWDKYAPENRDPYAKRFMRVKEPPVAYADLPDGAVIRVNCVEDVPRAPLFTRYAAREGLDQQ